MIHAVHIGLDFGEAKRADIKRAFRSLSVRGLLTPGGKRVQDRLTTYNAVVDGRVFIPPVTQLRNRV